MSRGRPGYSKEKKAHLEALCREWATEIKAKSGLSSAGIEKAVAYGSCDGRTWRALMAGTRFPSEATFFRILGLASKNGWLGPFGYLRYERAWHSHDSNAEEVPDDDYSDVWCRRTFRSTVLMMLTHAQRCGIARSDFFSMAQVELIEHEGELGAISDMELLSRASNVAARTLADLRDGPEPPHTALLSNIHNDLGDFPA